MAPILVVEDDGAIGALITDILEGSGFQTECVQTDVAAYKVLQTRALPAGVIVDVNLGRGTTGFDVARFARKVAPRIPVIYVSGDSDQVSFQTFGVPDSDFLAKPFTPDQLLSKVSARLDAQQAP